MHLAAAHFGARMIVIVQITEVVRAGLELDREPVIYRVVVVVVVLVLVLMLLLIARKQQADVASTPVPTNWGRGNIAP